VRAYAPHQLINRGRLLQRFRRHATMLDGLERPSGRTAPSGITPSPIMSPASTTRPRTEIRLGACAHQRSHRRPPAHAPPSNHSRKHTNPDAALGAVSPDR